MAYEDFTTYAETDLAGELTVIANKITFTNLARDEEVHVMKDFTAGYFTDFHMRWKASWTAVTDSDVSMIALTNGETGRIPGAFAGDGLYAFLLGSGHPLNTVGIVSYDGTGSDSYTLTAALPQTFWVDLERIGLKVNMILYSDAYSTVIDMMTFTKADADIPYRYLFAAQGTQVDPVDNDTISGTVENLEIISVGNKYPLVERASDEQYQLIRHSPINKGRFWL